MTEFDMFEPSLTATCVNLKIAVTVVPAFLQTLWWDCDLVLKGYLNLSELI